MLRDKFGRNILIDDYEIHIFIYLSFYLIGVNSISFNAYWLCQIIIGIVKSCYHNIPWLRCLSVLQDNFGVTIIPINSLAAFEYKTDEEMSLFSAICLKMIS